MSAAGPSLVASPSGSSSTESQVEFDPNMDLSDQCTDFSSVFPGEFQKEDAEDLQQLGWVQRTDAEKAAWLPAWVPYWTRPGWDPSIEVSFDGTQQRAARGDAESFMRPTILPGDNEVPRTDYTKRWGINPIFPKTANDEARSGLTPTTAAADPGAPRQWTHEESWQSYWWSGLTTQELIDTGVHAPDADITVSDLPANAIHPLFSRNRWAQPRSAEGIGGSTARKRHLDMMYSLSGVQGRYDAEINDYLWDALQPSIRLASNVINSAHPTWAMFLRAFYHLRKVPYTKDGRTDQEKNQDSYRPYQTLWHEINENEMYDSARDLYHLGFDVGLATMGILYNRLKWGFNETSPPCNGNTTTDSDWSIHIFLNANSVWALLADEYSESEKVGIRVKLAATMLHELTHACHAAHHQMMERPVLRLANIPGITVTRNSDIELFLQELRYEAVGTGTRYENGRQYLQHKHEHPHSEYRILLMSFSIENDIQMEEGKAFDNRLWGGIIEYFPPIRSPAALRAGILTRNWPYAHPEIYRQNVENVKAGNYEKFTKLPYKTFLLSPRAGVYDFFTPTPISNYSHLFRSSWWTYDFQRYGHQAIKIASTGAEQSSPIQSILVFQYMDFDSVILPLVGNLEVCRFVASTAPNILKKQNQNLILAWLSKVSLEVAGAKIMRLRLYYERRTWDDKYSKILNLCEKISQQIAVSRSGIQSLASGNATGIQAFGAPDIGRVTSLLNTLLRQDLPELHTQLDYESRYAQNIAAEYFLKDLDNRWLVRRSMHILLGHLQVTLDRIGGILQAMLDVWADMGTSAAFTDQVEDCEAVYGRISASQTAIFQVIEILRGNTLDQRTGSHGPLAGVPTARRELQNGMNLRIAAMKEFARITDPKLKRVINTWLRVIEFSQDIRLDEPDAEDVVVGGGTIAELQRARDQAASDALAISLLEQQDQVAANRDQGMGMEPAEGEDEIMHDLQEEMDRIETSSDIVDLYASFSDEEKVRLGKGPNPS